jgi:hypothetical protein
MYYDEIEKEGRFYAVLMALFIIILSLGIGFMFWDAIKSMSQPKEKPSAECFNVISMPTGFYSTGGTIGFALNGKTIYRAPREFVCNEPPLLSYDDFMMYTSQVTSTPISSIDFSKK